MLEVWCARIESAYRGALGRAMAYSLRTPGKRFRPALVLATYRELGGAGDATELATAIEVVHSYSLVHDDLPCMDDDDLRRGRATTHKAFGVEVATEAGFRLVEVSGQVLAAGMTRLGLAAEAQRTIASELYSAAGAGGMVGGQVLDLEAEGREIDLAQLTAIHRAKTGVLIAAAAVVGAVAAGAEAATVEAVRVYGHEIGLTFQIVDDVLDDTASTAALGKTAGKDTAQHKATYTALLGIDGARQAAREHADRAVAVLRDQGLDSSLLAGLTRFIVERDS